MQLAFVCSKTTPMIASDKEKVDANLQTSVSSPPLLSSACLSACLRVSLHSDKLTIMSSVHSACLFDMHTNKFISPPPNWLVRQEVATKKKRKKTNKKKYRPLTCANCSQAFHLYFFLSLSCFQFSIQIYPSVLPLVAGRVHETRRAETRRDEQRKYKNWIHFVMSLLHHHSPVSQNIIITVVIALVALIS